MADGRKLIPLFDQSEPVACSLSPAELDTRLAELGRLGAAVDSIERTATGALIGFHRAPDVAAALGRFVAAESACCRFWGFEIADGEDLVLRWDGPPEAQELLDQLLIHLNPEAPVTKSRMS